MGFITKTNNAIIILNGIFREKWYQDFLKSFICYISEGILINKLNKSDNIGEQDIKHKFTIINLIFNSNKIIMEKINFGFAFYI